MHPRSSSVQRRSVALGAVLAALLVVPPQPAQSAVPPGATAEQRRLSAQEQQALADLDESSAQVREAAVALSAVAAQLPAARGDVARARGALAGAQAKLRAAEAELERAEVAVAAGAQQVEAAGRRVQEGRDEVGRMARRTYQRGRLGGLRDVVDAGEPQDVLERASMLRSVFRHQDASLDRLTDARLSLARTQAGLAADERAVERARARAQEQEARAGQITAEAEAAAARVASLVATRASALASAEDARAADQAQYASAQAASRALAARIREAARRAEVERVRRAAAERAAAERAAAERAAAERAAAERTAEGAASGPAAGDAASRAVRRRSTAVPDQPSASAGGGWVWPCAGCPQTSAFGWRTHPIFGDRRLHAGIDLGAPTGTTVRAAAGGTVLIAGPTGGYGNFVVVDHGSGLSTAYAHMDSVSVRAGQSVQPGQKVGEVGSTGNSTGPHLHFELRRNGDPIDPLSQFGPS